MKRLVFATATSLGAVVLVTGIVYALRPAAPVLSLGVLYLFAVLPVAAIWGLRFAIPVSIVSMLAFNWLFLPPRHTFHLAESQDWVALVVYVATAVSVSALAARARQRAAEAERRRREAAFAAETAGLLLEQGAVAQQLAAIAVLAADLLGVPHCWIELGAARAPESGEEGHALVAGGRHIGTIYLSAGRADSGLTARVVGTLSPLLGTAVEREELARSDATKTAVLRSVSHDLRSPLTAIRTASEMVADPDADLSAADRLELLTSIRTEARRLDRLVRNLLDLSRLEAGASPPAAELWAVDSLVAQALDAVGGDGERVVVSFPEHCPAIRVDPAQVERVVVNLVENALGNSSPTDPVEIRVTAAGGEVAVAIADRGPGIPAAEQEAIFEPFRRGSLAGARGSGLGLAIARGFAELNGGRITVRSEPGGGATFTLAFPAVEIPTEVSR